jgi:hypothetical protein
MEEGIDMITDTSNRGARVRNGLGGAMRANQVPLALIGLGTAGCSPTTPAWLSVSRRTSASKPRGAELARLPTVS